MSREQHSNQVSLYKADLNTRVFFSEKGLRERKQKVKYKWVTAKIKPNNDEESKGFFGGIPDGDRWFHMLWVHNFKVQKILDKAFRSHEDRQYGVIKPQVVPKSEDSAPPKKSRRGKKINPIDVTIKFKSEDGHIEEI